MHLYSVEFQWFSTRDIERDSGGGGCYDCENQEGGAPLRCCSRPEIMWSKNLLLPMTTGSICGKLFPESRKCPSQNSSILTNAISAAARTSWLCRYSMSRAQGHIRAQLIGDRANPTQLKERHRRAARGTAAHFFCGASCCLFFFVLVLGLLQRDAESTQRLRHPWSTHSVSWD